VTKAIDLTLWVKGRRARFTIFSPT
jgi:hypothetical protein